MRQHDINDLVEDFRRFRNTHAIKRLVGKPLPCRAFHEAFEALQGVARNIALVEPESELVQMASKVLVADVVERTVDAALQHCPNRLDTVSRNAVPRVFARAVVYRLMGKRPTKAEIRVVFVGVDRRPGFRGPIDRREDRRLIGFWDDLRLGVAAALATPAEATRSGADFIVVGRPIYQADDPIAAAKAIITETETVKD